MLSFAALALLAAPTSADWSDGLVGIDFKYNDITSFEDPSNSSLKCYTSCINTPECVGWVFCPAGDSCCGVNATCWLKSAMADALPGACRVAGYTPSAVSPQAFWTTPVGSVTPSGWLHDELVAQGSGLTGFLAAFWDDISNSSWIGGKADGGLHERTPYWLNGLVPLSYLTNDPNLVAQRTKYLDFIITNQAPSGWIGIDDMAKDGNQYWGRMNIVLSLIQDYEGGGNAASLLCVFKYLAEAYRRLQLVPLDGWACARAQDMIMGVFWLVDAFDSLPSSAIPSGTNQATLILLADLLHSQMISQGCDWRTWFDTPEFPTGPACVGPAPCNMLTHGVNIGQAIKSEAVWYRRSQDLADAASTYVRMEKLVRHARITRTLLPCSKTDVRPPVPLPPPLTLARIAITEFPAECSRRTSISRERFLLTALRRAPSSRPLSRTHSRARSSASRSSSSAPSASRTTPSQHR